MEVDALALHLGVQVSQSCERLGRDGEAESRHDSNLSKGRARIAGPASGILPVPSCDLVAGQADRVVLGGQKRGGAGRSDGLDAAAADHAQARVERAGEERVLRLRKGGAEDEGRGGAGRDAPPDEFGRDEIREDGVGQPGLCGEHAALQPLEQLAPAELVGRQCLREVHVRVDEAGEEEPACDDDGVVGEGCRQARPRAGVRDAPGGVDGQRAIRFRDQRIGRPLERRAACHVEQMAPVDRHCISFANPDHDANAGMSSHASGAAPPRRG